MDELGFSLIAEVRHRLVKGFPEQVRTALFALSDDEIWARHNEQSMCSAPVISDISPNTP